MDVAKKRKPKKRKEIYFNSSINNALRTIHIKARIDKIQQNSRCVLCGERDETINHIKSVCCKLAEKEYKTRHN